LNRTAVASGEPPSADWSFPDATVIALAGPGRAGAIESLDAHAAIAKRMAERRARWNARSIVRGSRAKCGDDDQVIVARAPKSCSKVSRRYSRRNCASVAEKCLTDSGHVAQSISRNLRCVSLVVPRGISDGLVPCTFSEVPRSC
jgi:hypothetical protein